MTSCSRRPATVRQVLNPAESNPLLRYEFDGGSDYETDTRVTLALGALIPEAELRHPDQRFFQLVHLCTEYMWAAAHHEMVRATHAIDADNPADAALLLSRAGDLADVPVQLVRVMQVSFPQSSFLALRDGFPAQTTGLDSPGMRNLRRAARALWGAALAALDLAGVTLLEVRQTELDLQTQAAGAVADPGRALRPVLAAAHQLDARVLEWKRAHILLVWMILGGLPDAETPAGSSEQVPTSLRGRPVTDLERLASKPLFPSLWQTSAEMFRAAVGGRHA
jgi:tryptophan 2,3-dioxygenase